METKYFQVSYNVTGPDGFRENGSRVILAVTAPQAENSVVSFWPDGWTGQVETREITGLMDLAKTQQTQKYRTVPTAEQMFAGAADAKMRRQAQTLHLPVSNVYIQ